LDRELARHLARIEGKINIAAKGLSLALGIVGGFAAYLLASSSEYHQWAVYIGWGGGLVAARWGTALPRTFKI